jgi:hypothetical protein
MYSVRCSVCPRSIPAASRPPAERTKSPRRPPAAQATPVAPNRQRPLPGSRQLVQASSRSRKRFRDPGPRVHHRAIGLSAAVDLEDGAAHINPSGLSRGCPSTSPQPPITAVRAPTLTGSSTTLGDQRQQPGRRAGQQAQLGPLEANKLDRCRPGAGRTSASSSTSPGRHSVPRAGPRPARVIFVSLGWLRHAG